MLKKFFGIELIIIGVILFFSGVIWGIANYDCTEHSTCDGLVIEECVEWDTNQQIGCFSSILGFLIIINGVVVLYDAERDNGE